MYIFVCFIINTHQYNVQTSKQIPSITGKCYYPALMFLKKIFIQNYITWKML